MGMRTILIGDGETHEPAKSHAPKNYFRIAVQRDRRVCPVIAKNQLSFSRKICFSAHVLIPPRGAFRDRHERWKRDAMDALPA